MLEPQKNFLSEFEDLESDVSDYVPQNILNKEKQEDKKDLREIEGDNKKDNQLYLF